MQEYKLKNGKTLKVYNDGSAESPRSWDNLAKMVFFGGKESLGDKHNIVLNRSYASRWEFAEQGAEDVKKMMDAVICLPVHYYEHGGAGISLSANEYPFNCPWDSGTIGFAVVTKSDLRKEYNLKCITQKAINKALTVVKGEVETLNQYIAGEVYGFRVFNEKGEEEDSCWGFYGDDVKTNGMLYHVGELAE
jgi:hypothetical protein